MDLLLQNYGSSEDESDPSLSNNKTKIGGRAVGEAPTVDVECPPVSSSLSGGANSTITPKAKKLLSLSNVLPPHILERLTAANNGLQLDSSEDDDHDDDEELDKKKQQQQKAVKNKLNQAAITSKKQTKDDVMGSLLSDLSAAPTTMGYTKKSSSSSSLPLAGETSMPSSKERMGEAFLTSSTTELNRDSTAAVVLDVHAQRDTKTSTTTTGRSTRNDDERRLRPKTSSRVAAPVVVRRPIQATISTGARDRVETPTTLPSGNHNPPQTEQPTAEAAPQQQQQQQTKKRSRKELERALRHGDLSVVEEDADMTRMQQVAPDHYYVPQQSQQQGIPTHNIKVVPTAMYDPSAGQAVTSINKGRGKNQINQLLANAASLEASRLQQPNANLGKIHRANAKQKYGW